MSGTPITVTETQEKIHRQKTRAGDPQAGYLEEKIVGSEYINITEAEGAVGKKLVVSIDAAKVATGISDHKVMVDSTDTEEYLESKLEAGDGIALAKAGTSPEAIIISGDYVAGTGITITGASTQKTIATTITQVVTEDPFTGSADVVPESSAVSDLLLECTITDDPDILSGDALLYNSRFISTNEMDFVEKSEEDTTDMWDADKYPKYATYITQVPVWQTSNNYRLAMNKMGIYSTYSAEGTNQWAVVLLPIMIQEDISDEDATVFLDVMFECPVTDGASTTARVKATARFLKADFASITGAYVSDIQDVVYPVSTGASIVRKITFELDLSAMILAGLTFDTPVFAQVGLMCEAINADPAPTETTATILGARFMYKTKTLGLRIGDVS
jgi:hypothetical protein